MLGEQGGDHGAHGRGQIIIAHPAIFDAALQLTSARPEEIVMVGDSVSADVRGAEAVGMHAVLIDREGTRSVPGDVRVVRSLLDVPLEWITERTTA